VLGPLLRYVSQTAATIWVETDRACDVGILGRRARTFEVAGHHYALVAADDLRPGSEYEYQVTLDGVVRWPQAGSPFPPSTVRTPRDSGPVRLAFGSCRVTRAHGPRRGKRAREAPDALAACAMGLRATARDRWPDALLMIGDQVYADNPGPATREFIRRRRDPRDPPGYEVADFAEYCALYHEAWREPAVRWLLSVIPTSTWGTCRQGNWPRTSCGAGYARPATPRPCSASSPSAPTSGPRESGGACAGTSAGYASS
jgi:phosphodiesterase/alkaline phosphatase D-like protein